MNSSVQSHEADPGVLGSLSMLRSPFKAFPNSVQEVCMLYQLGNT